LDKIDIRFVLRVSRSHLESFFIMEAKRARYSPPPREQQERQSALHSLLNFAESTTNFEHEFRASSQSKIPNAETEFKLAPIHAISENMVGAHYHTEPSRSHKSNSMQENQSYVQSLPSHHPKSLSNEIQLEYASQSLPHVEIPHQALHVVTQPVGYQIANYNIHPPPALSLDRAIAANLTIHAQLVESEKRTVVDGGFQSGDVRVLRGGHTTLYFTGLKLNKMGPIKTELQLRDYKRIPTSFCIQFKIGNKIIFSEPFKLVSSCAQLPQDVRDIVRPTKRASRGSSPEPEPHSHKSPPMGSPHSQPQNQMPLGQIVQSMDTEVVQLRRDLETAIESADVEAAGQVARKLAYLKKVQLAHMDYQNVSMAR